MPFTPLHIGIPGLPSYFKPDRVDIVAVVLGSTLVDIDFFLHVVYRSPLHGFLHTYIGATALALVLSVLIRIGKPVVERVKGWFRWEKGSNVKSITFGAFLGTYSHVLLDSLIYYDVDPFHPLSEDNPFYVHEWVDQMTGVVYALAGLTTLLLTGLWARRFTKDHG